METIQEELGPDIDMGVEAHWRYDVGDAINMAKAIEPVKPMWLEDPVAPGNPQAMARVTHAVTLPICTGENLYTRDGFRRLIELQGATWCTSTFPNPEDSWSPSVFTISPTTTTSHRPRIIWPAR